ncbi:MAG TPA: T9SS type A sorting domain-containing protein, partial [bacterium]|nr:T9SS type A sorting domain-containing protein [bacterium]
TVGWYKVSVYFGHFYRGNNKVARYTLYHKDGSSQFDINQENSANYNRWIDLGTFEFDGIFTLDINPVVEPIVADAVKLEPVSIGGSLARNLPERSDLNDGFDEVVAETFDLSDPYPNPFNSQTIISYHVAEPTMVSINIYNQIGQEIRTLINEDKYPGIYQVIWDGRDNFGNQASTGIYLYRMRADKFIAVKKIILIH